MKLKDIDKTELINTKQQKKPVIYIRIDRRTIVLTHLEKKCLATLDQFVCLSFKYQS
jgi:hypothetical protein